jgi:hypothetical protein
LIWRLGEVEDVIRDGVEEPIVDIGVDCCAFLIVRASL